MIDDELMGKYVTACKYDSLDKVKRLLLDHPSLTYRAESKYAGAEAALYNTDRSVIHHLMTIGVENEGAKFYDLSNSLRAEPLLHVFARYGDTDLMQRAVRIGISVNLVDDAKRTPLHVATLHRNLDAIRLLIDLGAEINSKNVINRTPLHMASNEASVSILLQNGAIVDGKDNFGNTPLHRIAQAAGEKACKLLIDSGANLNAKNDEGLTALHLAGDVDTLDFLIRSGADVDDKDILGATALHINVCAHNAKASKLLIDRGAKVDEKSNDGRTALHYATDKETIEVLLEAGADVNMTNPTGCTPLHLRAFADKPEICQLLIDGGADINACNLDGDTPLVTASCGMPNFDTASNGTPNFEVVVALLDAGADPAIANKYGYTLMSFSQKNAALGLIWKAYEARQAMANVLAQGRANTMENR